MRKTKFDFPIGSTVRYIGDDYAEFEGLVGTVNGHGNSLLFVVFQEDPDPAPGGWACWPEELELAGPILGKDNQYEMRF